VIEGLDTHLIHALKFRIFAEYIFNLGGDLPVSGTSPESAFFKARACRQTAQREPEKQTG